MNLTKGLTALLVIGSLSACGKKEEQYPDLSGYVKPSTGTPGQTLPPATKPAPSTAPIVPPAATQSPEGTPGIAQAPSGSSAASSSANTATPAKKASFAKANSIAGEYSRYAFGQGKYWESLVAQVEGYRASPYRDNIGVAIGYGYNASYQSRPTNRRAGLEAIGSEQAAQTLEGLTKNFDPPSLPAIQVNPEQAMGMSLLLKPGYEDPMRAWIPGFEKLKPNQQAVLVYHAYKTGAGFRDKNKTQPIGGATTYSVLKAKIAAMLANPTEENTRAAGAQFQYKYTVRGETKTDTRSTVYMQALWSDPEAYGQLIGGKASSFVATLPEFKGSGKSSIGDSDIADPMGEVKLEMERTGKRIPVTIKRAEVDRALMHMLLSF